VIGKEEMKRRVDVRRNRASFALRLELACYLVLDPVRARMVAHAADYPCSSYGGPGYAAVHKRVRARLALAPVSPERPEAVTRYVDFVRAGVGLPSVWEHLQGAIILGSKPLKNWYAALQVALAATRQ
jgi:hypothetical protein